MRRRLNFFLVLLAAISAFGPCPAGAQTPEFQNVKVKPGDTLWSIANFYLKDPVKWSEILKYNKLPTSDPSIALPGIVLKVPVNLIKENLLSAKLIYLLNEVFYRRQETPDWKNAQADMALYRNDGLRTLKDSKAKLKFYNGEILNISPNSIIVLQPPSKNTDVELLSGEVRSLRSRVVTAAARITPTTRDTDFSAKVKENLTTLIQVYKGKADVEASGKIINVPAGFASEVVLDMPPSEPIKLPPPPAFAGEGSTKLKKLKSGPEISFKGTVIFLKTPQKTADAVIPLSSSKSERTRPASEERAPQAQVKAVTVGNPIQGYHVQVSRDNIFSKIVLDTSYSALEQADLKEKLPAGNYWVRIALIDLLGLEGTFTAPRKISVTDSPPKLEIISPKPGEKFFEAFLPVEGITEKDAEAAVNGQTAFIDSNGRFVVTVKLAEGQNNIETTATGKHGLSSRILRTVYYARTNAPQEEIAPPKSPLEQFTEFIGTGFGFTLFISGVMIVTIVLIFLL